MKRILMIVFLTALVSYTCFAQKLTLSDLINLCNKNNWDDINRGLLAKNWSYFDSEKGDTYKYNTITWAYNKDFYSDEAEAWFYLYTYEGYPNKISYDVFNKESYSIIQNSISAAGFKRVNSEIEDNQLNSTYINTQYTLEISTIKQTSDDWMEKSTTAYRITLVKKAGVFDSDNGKKTESYTDGTIKAEYSLLNGKLNGIANFFYENGILSKTGYYSGGIESGLFKEYDEGGNLIAEYFMSNGLQNGSLKTYYSNGKLNKTGHYLNDKENGRFIEYDENGNIQVEYLMTNGKKNGIQKIYKEGKLEFSTTFKDSIRNGQDITYYYNDETGKLQFKSFGEYLNDEKNGVWKLIFIDENNKEKVLDFETYTNGAKNGAFQETQGDSLIIGSYKNDKLHGQYKIYVDLLTSLVGGVVRTDTTSLILIVEGSFYEDEKSGYWKYYDLTKTLRSEGKFLKDKQDGEWRYYYTNYSDDKGNSMPYSKKLFLIQNYSNGELEGKRTRFSYLEEKKYLCSEIDKSRNPWDTCIRYLYDKVYETSFYKNGILNGYFELLDSINEPIAKGYFKDDLRHGEWFHRYTQEDLNNNTNFLYQKGNYANDKRDGKWIQYYIEGKISETFNYQNGELHGEYLVWDQFNKLREKKQFSYGVLSELIVNDSLGIKPKYKYEIYDNNDNSYKCRMTTYNSDNASVSQEYWVKKEKEIDHSFFEMSFALSVGKQSDGTLGYKDGQFKLFNSNNQPLVSGEYYKQDKIGLWTYYFYDQGVKVQSNFEYNKQKDEKYFNLNGEFFSGEFVYIDELNSIKEERKIKNGVRNGKTMYCLSPLNDWTDFKIQFRTLNLGNHEYKTSQLEC